MAGPRLPGFAAELRLGLHEHQAAAGRRAVLGRADLMGRREDLLREQRDEAREFEAVDRLLRRALETPPLRDALVARRLVVRRGDPPLHAFDDGTVRRFVEAGG